VHPEGGGFELHLGAAHGVGGLAFRVQANRHASIYIFFVAGIYFRLKNKKGGLDTSSSGSGEFEPNRLQI
jgi:hypothetical protein